MCGDAVDYDTQNDENAFRFVVTPKNRDSAPIDISYDKRADVMKARFGKHTTSVALGDELSSGVDNVLAISEAVVFGRFAERIWYSRGIVVRSSACVLFRDGKRRHIVDGSPLRLLVSLLSRGRPVEIKYLPYVRE